MSQSETRFGTRRVALTKYYLLNTPGLVTDRILMAMLGTHSYHALRTYVLRAKMQLEGTGLTVVRAESIGYVVRPIQTESPAP